MVGIIDYSEYVPRWRLRRDLIAEEWGSRSLGGLKAVANFDEDALTLGFEAAHRLVERDGRKEIVDALYFASTTSPYWQRAASSFIAAACDLPDQIETVDFGGSVRAGTSALRAGLNAVSAGSANKVIITAADVREGAPESTEEQLFGDGSAALLLGRDKLVAELVAQASYSDDFLDEWRRDRDRYVTVLSSKYSTERGYVANAVAAGRRVLEKAGIKPSDISRVALSSPDGKAHNIVAKKLGFAGEQLVEVQLQDGGLSGTPLPLGLLCRALDSATPNSFILVVGHGDGADALLFRTTDKGPRPVGPTLKETNLEVPSYTIYRKLREFTRSRADDGAVISNVMFEKEEKQNVRLHGVRCTKCETVQYPPAPVCVSCRNQGFEEVRLAQRGTIFTYTKDYLYGAPNPPTAMAVLELEDGARFYCQVTDIDAEKVEIGQPVELTLRRMKDGGGMHHYYWKCRPV